MLVLHALPTAAGDLALWAEDAELPVRQGRATAAAAPHPFGVSSVDLATLVGGTTAAGSPATTAQPYREGLP